MFAIIRDNSGDDFARARLRALERQAARMAPRKYGRYRSAAGSSRAKAFVPSVAMPGCPPGRRFSAGSRWIARHKEFRAWYISARDFQAEGLGEEMFEILRDASGDNLARARLKALERQAARMAPKKYGR